MRSGRGTSAWRMSIDLAYKVAQGRPCQEALDPGRRRKRIATEHLTAAIVANQAHDQHNDRAENEERNPKKPSGLHDAVPSDRGRIGAMNRAKHGDHVVADGGIFAEVDGSEHADEVMRNGGVVVQAHVAEETDHVVVGVAGNVDVAEEDNDVVVEGALPVDAAKEAHGVVYRSARRYDDIAAKLNLVPVGVGGDGGKCKSR